MDFQDRLAQSGGFVGENTGRDGAMLTPANPYAFLGLLPLCQFWRKSVKKCYRESADRRTDTRTDRDKLNLLSVPCYILQLWGR